MFLSKEKLLIAYYYIALIVFAVSACGVMFEQESENGISYINFIIAFAFVIWGVLCCVPSQKAIF